MDGERHEEGNAGREGDGMKLNALKVTLNPHDEESRLFPYGKGYKALMKYDGRRLTVPFHCSEEDFANGRGRELLLKALADEYLDYALEGCDSFEGYCDHYGFDPEEEGVRKQHRDFVKHQKKVEAFLGGASEADEFCHEVLGEKRYPRQ